MNKDFSLRRLLVALVISMAITVALIAQLAAYALAVRALHVDSWVVEAVPLSLLFFYLTIDAYQFLKSEYDAKHGE
jgi:hypothetical protein